MNTPVALILFALSAIYILAIEGTINGKVIFVITFMSVLIGIPWYFYKNRNTTPSKVEIIVANIWLFIRRAVGFIAAIFFFVTSVMAFFGLLKRTAELEIISRIGLGSALLAASFFCVWLAVYGQGKNRLDWKDDVELHNKNKKRYHWPW